MLESINQYKNIIFFVGLALLGLVLVSMFFGGGPSVATLTSEQIAQTNVAERELLSTLLELRNITLDESIFADDTFRSLRDFSQELVPEPVGRPNPFSPLSF